MSVFGIEIMEWKRIKVKLICCPVCQHLRGEHITGLDMYRRCRHVGENNDPNHRTSNTSYYTCDCDYYLDDKKISN